MKMGYQIKQKLEGDIKVANMSLYGRIGDGTDIDSAQVVSAVSDLRVDRLNVYYNSVGGDPFHGFAIGNRLSKLQAEGQIGEIHSFAEGIVGSAATIPFLHGETRHMMNGSRFFIHKGSAFMAIGGTVDSLPSEEQFAETYRNFRKDLETTNQQAAELYVEKSNLTAEQVEKAMDVTTTYGPKEAVAAGFATHESAIHAVAACVTRDQILAIHPDLPDNVREFFPEKSVRQVTVLHPDKWDQGLGPALARLLNSAIDSIDESSSDSRSGADVIEEMGNAAGIDSGTVNQILSGTITCPPLNRLSGFAGVSGIPSLASQRTAAESDGCNYES